MENLSWTNLRAFLAAAETQSFSSAARRLGLTQPTVSRQVAALEAELDVILFARTGKSLLPTAAALSLLPHARRMGEAADGFALVAAGQGDKVEGVVSVSASDGIAVHLLPPLVAQLKEVAPSIQIEIITSNGLSDLRRREADIAVRHVRPEGPELFAKFLRTAHARFYASRTWVARNGAPQRAEEAAAHSFIGYNRNGEMEERLRPLGVDLNLESFAVLSENSLTAWAMVEQGLGIGIMMDDIARRSPHVVQVLNEVPVFEFPIWLVTHSELKTNKAIRTVFDVMARELRMRSALQADV